MPRPILAPLQLEGELFLLTFPLIEPQGGPISLGPRRILKSPPIVNGPPRKGLINHADHHAECWQSNEYAGCLLRTTWACDRESRLDFIASKTCAIGREPMLTAGWKEHRSGARTKSVRPIVNGALQRRRSPVRTRKRCTVSRCRTLHLPPSRPRY